MKKHINTVKLEWIHAGYCIQKESFSILTGRHRQIKFYAGAGIIYHPKGIFLFDTGYSNHFFKETNKYPYNLYAKLTPVFCRNKDTLRSNLAAKRIKLSQINGIFLSHFHADHIAGLKDFPKIPIYCMESAYKDIRGKIGFKALKKGFIPNLLPNDFEKRVILLNNFTPIPSNMDLAPFDSCIDVFNDHSLYAVQLNGHAKGQMGLYINMANPIFLVADACWSSQAYRNNIPPPWYVRFFLGNNREYLTTLEKLYLFHKKHTNVLILPSHCNEF